ncbi:hypothetical protein KC19_6G208900 [Ceratodon purpureus]|uniref:Uncharacterized protein n=1 Tax=Ceratodon purpureus TaxID=3225 RepID=A0A8T0HJU8_CERPU|nr:hypothetical protein KC19_6G208900 [Ceratodon purpureus]
MRAKRDKKTRRAGSEALTCTYTICGDLAVAQNGISWQRKPGTRCGSDTVCIQHEAHLRQVSSWRCSVEIKNLDIHILRCMFAVFDLLSESQNFAMLPRITEYMFYYWRAQIRGPPGSSINIF